MKFFDDIAVYIRRWKNTKMDEEESANKTKEEDNRPGNVVVSMVDGTHSQPYTINNKLIKLVVVSVASLILFAFFYKMQQNPKKTDSDETTTISQEAADPSRAQIQDKDSSSYQAFFSSNRNASAGGGTPPPLADGRKKTDGEESARNGENPLGQQLPRRTETSAPPIISPPPNNIPLPPMPALPPEANRVSEEEKKAADRLRSAISFGIGTSTGAIQGNTEINTVTESTDMQKISAPEKVTYISPGKYTLQAGTLIPAMLFSGINTDSPGQVTAQVMADVYDSAAGTNILIPLGSKLLGTYDGSNTNTGRVNIKFSLVVLPDGGSYSVGENLVAIDGKGYNGVSGKIDRHTAQTLSGGMLSSAIAALGSYAAGSPSGDANTYTAGQLAAQGAISNLMNGASELFKKGTDRAATITIEPGYEFNVYVVSPIQFNKGA